MAKPGDTIYLRGGVYTLTAGIHLTNDGSSGKPITVMNYPGEVPVLDGSGMTSSGYYGKSAGGWVLDLASVSWNHIKGLEIRGGPMGGLVIRDASDNNIIEQLNVHHNGRLSQYEGKGITLVGSSANNLLLNNDSHHNQDLRHDNADGFAVNTTGTGNVLRGNRAWGNSDDGFDFFNAVAGTKAAPLLVEGNWAFDNGYDLAHAAAGDGNGFKLGGARPDSGSISGGHTLIDNTAWENRGRGFDENQSTAPHTLYNNTAYNNGTYNFGFWDQPNLLRNNLAYGSGQIAAKGSDTVNSWTLPVTLTAADFQSLDDAAARGARAADGSLPVSGFLRPVQGSDIIDKGTPVGTAYSGQAPDLGAFEFDMPLRRRSSQGRALPTRTVQP